ncbi:cytochrome P450 [Aspergillus granulosus]|uniref:Cytochrome P450 n=1 Tax=Aspergillus granulosus TaxID=176169 RepID=A0ABR4HXQ5_9EURO
MLAVFSLWAAFGACLLYVPLTAIWCLYLHPLRRIPGPKSWIILPVLEHASAIWGRRDADLRRFHAEYGPAVRYGRDKVSFITVEGWKEIYGHGHRQLPKVRSSASNPLDIIDANDEDHTRYRRALSHAFSAKGLQDQEPLLNSYVSKLIERLKGVAESQLPADMVKWYNLCTFDIIGDLAFGEPFGGLDNSEYHHWVATIFQSIKAVPFKKLADSYPLIAKAALVVTPKGLLQARQRQLEHSKVTVQKRLQNSAAYGRNDFMNSMLRNQDGKNGLNEAELVANSNILIIAGSETTATLLSGVTYWITRNPHVLDKVKAEVRSVMKSDAEITVQKASTELPYMLACIDEAFRMYPPVPTGLERRTITPVRISGYEIAPGTAVSVHQSASYWSPINFYAPDRFLPERWLPEARNDPSSPFFTDNRDVVQPFSVGPRNCIGRNLAFAEMRVILARVLWNFDLELCEESENWFDQKTYNLWEKPELMCKLKLREL